MKHLRLLLPVVVTVLLLAAHPEWVNAVYNRLADWYWERVL